MNLMKEILFTMIAVVGLSVAVSAQKKPDNPPPKNPPPVVKPGKPEKPPQKLSIDSVMPRNTIDTVDDYILTL